MKLTDVITAGQSVIVLCIYVQHQSLIVGRRVHVVVQLEVHSVVVVVFIVVSIQIVSITVGGERELVFKVRVG